MGFCKGLGKMYLVVANVITMLLGLAVIGCASYALVQFSEFADMFSKTGLGITVGAGVLMFLVSIAGCQGALKQNKCLLGIYTAAMVLTFIVFVGAGIAVAIYKGALLEISDGQTAVTATEKFQQSIASMELATFRDCCSKVYNNVQEPQKCPSGATLNGCYVDQKVYDEFNGKALCEGLQELKVNGHYIVADPNLTDGCGKGDALKFQKDISIFVDNNATYMIAGSATVAALQLLCLIFSCCLVCENREEYDPEYKRRQEAKAGNFTGTQGAPINSKGTNYV